MLDAGAGDCKYAHLFSTMTYESADFGKVEKSYGRLTYECDLASIPAESERYDLALLTQVLEHLPDPLAVLKELHRVLRPGHRLWLSQPHYYEEHEQRHTAQLRAGINHTCGVTTDGRAYCWGENYLGQLARWLENPSTGAGPGEKAIEPFADPQVSRIRDILSR